MSKTRWVRPNIEQLPVYEPGKPIEEVAREYQPTQIVKLASNENPLGPSPKAVQAMQEAVCEVHRYPDGSCFRLRQKLAAKLSVPEGSLLFGNGSNDVIEIIAQTFLEPSDHVVLSQYSFALYTIVSRLMGVKIEYVPSKNYGHDLQAMASAIQPNTKMICVCNPNNPTGTQNSKQELLDFLNAVPKEVMIVLDEAYYEYVCGEDYLETLPLLEQYQNLIVLRTFSKIYGLAGLRIGYAISSLALSQEMNKVRQPFNVDLVAQSAAIAALDDQEHLTKTRDNNQQGLAYLSEQMEALGLDVVPSRCNFLLVAVKRGGQELYQALLEQGAIIRPMGAYGLPNHIRVSVGLPKENEYFIEALKKVLN